MKVCGNECEEVGLICGVERRHFALFLPHLDSESRLLAIDFLELDMEFGASDTQNSIQNMVTPFDFTKSSSDGR